MAVTARSWKEVHEVVAIVDDGKGKYRLPWIVCSGCHVHLGRTRPTRKQRAFFCYPGLPLRKLQFATDSEGTCEGPVYVIDTWLLNLIKKRLH